MSAPGKQEEEAAHRHYTALVDYNHILLAEGNAYSFNNMSWKYF